MDSVGTEELVKGPSRVLGVEPVHKEKFNDGEFQIPKKSKS